MCYLPESERKRWKISKKPLSHKYQIEPEATSPSSQEYHAHLSDRTNGNWPYIFLHQGPKDIVKCARRPKVTPNYELAPGDEDPLEGKNWTEMNYDNAQNQATFTITMPDGQAKEIMWRETKDVSVDGTKQSRLGGGYKLVDMVGPDNILAVWTPKSGISTVGLMQINVDWGNDFEQMVFISFMCLFAGYTVGAGNNAQVNLSMNRFSVGY